MPYHERDIYRSREYGCDVANLLKEAGFSLEHTAWTSFLDRNSRRCLAEGFDKKGAVLVAQVFPQGDVRDLFFGKSVHNFNGAYYYTRMLTTLARVGGHLKTKDKQSEFIEGMARFVEHELDEPRQEEVDLDRFNEKIHIVIRIICNQRIYALFDNDTTRVAAHIKEHFRRSDSLYILEDIIEFLETGGEGILDEIGAPNENVLFLRRDHLRAIRSRKDLLSIVVEHLKSNKTWADTIKHFDEALCTVDLAGFRLASLDLAVMKNFSEIEALKLFAFRHRELRGRSLETIWSILQSILQDEESRHLRPETEAFNSDINQIIAGMANITPVERYKLLCHLYQELGDDGVDKVRAEMGFNQVEFNKASGEKIAWLREVMKRAGHREHPRHPLVTRGIVTKSGYEVEMKKLSNFQRKKLGDHFFTVADALGFRKGTDAFEASPGPFYDPETGIALFELLFDAGLANLYQEAGWSFHFNISLEKDDDFATVAWPFIVAGSADSYQEYEREYSASRTLSIRPNDKGRGSYLEGKVFRIMTRDQFYWTYRSATYLACAVNIYRNLCNQNKVKNLTPDELSTCKGGKIEKDITHHWLHFRHMMKCGLESCGLGPFAEDKTRIEGKYMRILHEQQALVYPDVVSRHNPLPSIINENTVELYCERPKMVTPIPVKIDGRTWPTALHFATDTINEAVGGILKSMAAFEIKVVKDMEKIDQATDPNRQRLISALFTEIHADVPAQASSEQKEAIYAEIRGLYK